MDETGKLQWKAQKGYIWINPLAFKQIEGANGYEESNIELCSSGYADMYSTPVQLPNGAIITKMTIYWSDLDSIVNAMFSLGRTQANGENTVEMAYVESTGSSGPGSSLDTSINYATIDNSQYTYYLNAIFVWPEYDLCVRSALIEYDFSGPY